MTKLLATILVIASVGLGASGYVAVCERFGSAASPLCTRVGEPERVLGVSPGMHGIFIYLAIGILAAMAIDKRRKAV